MTDHSEANKTREYAALFARARLGLDPEVASEAAEFVVQQAAAAFDLGSICALTHQPGNPYRTDIA